MKKHLRSVLSILVATSTLLTSMPISTAYAGALICGKEEHTHGESCYTSQLICGLEDNEGHAHDSSCYTNVLGCGKEEHIHTSSCYAPDETEALRPAETDAADTAEPSQTEASFSETEPPKPAESEDVPAAAEADISRQEEYTTADDGEKDTGAETKNNPEGIGTSTVSEDKDSQNAGETVLTELKDTSEESTHSQNGTEESQEKPSDEETEKSMSVSKEKLELKLSCREKSVFAGDAVTFRFSGVEEKKIGTVVITATQDGEKIYQSEKFANTISITPKDTGNASTLKVTISVETKSGAKGTAECAVPCAVHRAETANIWESTVNCELTGKWPEDLVAIAKTQLGYQESDIDFVIDENGRKQGYTRYGAWSGMPYEEWCAMFVSFCLNYAEIPAKEFPGQSHCQRWIETLLLRNLYDTEKENGLQKGNLIFFDWDKDGESDHVGIVKEVNGNEGYIKTIEGNSSRSVAERRYLFSDDTICGYGLLNKAYADYMEREYPEQTTEKATEEIKTEKETEAETEEETEEETEKETETEITTAVRKGPRKVSGAQVAADGVYTSTITATKTSKNKNYYGTLYVSVEDGKISYIRIVATDKQDRFNTIAYEAMAQYVGKTASVSNIVDAVSSASLSGSSSSGSKYTVNLTDAMYNALAGAPAASSSGTEAAETATAGVYTGTAAMSNGHYITLDVTVDENGKITDVAIADADGSWDSLLNTVSGNYLNGDANEETVDAVTSATPNGYREAIAEAIKNALSKAATGGSDTGSGGSDTPAGERTVYTSGTVQTVNGKTFTGEVYVESDAVITFVNCTFPQGITLEDADAAAIVQNCRFGMSGFYIDLASNYLGELYENTSVTKATGVSAAFPSTVADKENTSDTTSAALVDSSLATVPAWAKGTYYSPASGYYGYYLTGTTPDVEEETYQSFNTYLRYVDNSGKAAASDALEVTIPVVMQILPEEEEIPGNGTPGSGASAAVSEGGLTVTKGVDVSVVDETTEFSLDLEAWSTAQMVTSVTEGTAQPVDVVLLLDCSATMQTGDRFSNMKTQANAFLEKLKQLNPDSKAAVVFYGQYSSQNGHVNLSPTSWYTLSSGASTLESRISSQNYLTGDGYSYGTDHGGGYASAQTLFTSVSGDGRSKYLINISDGVFDYSVSPYYSTTEAAAMKNDGVEIYYISVGDSADGAKIGTLVSTPSSSHWLAGGNGGESIATALTSISGAIETETAVSNTALDKNAVFKDVVNTDKFDVSGATATVTIYDYNSGIWKALSGKATAASGSSGTLPSWTNKSTNDGTLTVKFTADGTVTITGFSYKDHYLPENGTEVSGVNAQKVHLAISGLKLKEGAKTSSDQIGVPTNDETQSGIYKSGNDNTAVTSFPLPTVTIPGDPSIPETVENVSEITVRKEWADGASNHANDTVTVQILPNSGSAVTVTLNNSNGWTQTVTTDPDLTYTVRETKVTSNGTDVTDQYAAAVSAPEMNTRQTQATGWAEVDKGAVSAGNTYVFTYTSNGTNYVLGRNGASVVGSTGGLTDDGPSSDIGNDYKWQVSAANSYYGNWYLKNLGNNSYLAVGNNYSTGYRPGAYLTSSASTYFNALFLDDDGSMWNRYGGYNLLASGSTVAANSSSWTEFTPYIYANITTTTNTAAYTITNTWNAPAPTADVIVKKVVGGNIGDRSKAFRFTAKITDAGGNAVNIAGLTDAEGSVSFALAHEEEKILEGLPVGAKLTITETDADGYTTTSEMGTVAGNAVFTLDSIPADGGTVVFRNVKESAIDTGIQYDQAPYLLILAGVVLLSAILVIRRRRSLLGS